MAAQAGAKRMRLPKLYRLVSIEARAVDPATHPRAKPAPEDADQDLFELSISSESPVEREDWWSGRSWIEILSHDPADIDMSRAELGLSFLRDHDVRKVDGIVDPVWIDEGDRQLKGLVRFSRNPSGRELKTDVRDRIRRFISVGYIPKEALLVKEDKKTGVNTYKLRWQPAETSSVAVPADIEAGVEGEVGRSLPYQRAAVGGRGEEIFDVPVIDGRGLGAEAEEDEMPKTEAPVQGKEQSAAQASPGGGVEVVGGSSGAGDARAQAAEIATMAAVHGFGERAGEWIAQGKTLAEVRQEIQTLKRGQQKPLALASAEALDAVPEKDLSRYSYREAVLQALALRTGGKPTGLSWDIHQELVRKGFSCSDGALLAPVDLGRPGRVRAMDSLTPGAGTELVFNQPPQIIDILRAKTHVVSMGARLTTGLSGGPIPFLKQTADMEVYAQGENPPADPTESDLAHKVLYLSPKTYIGAGRWSRQLMMTASIDMETRVRESLGSAHARKFDYLALHGSGVDGQPHGIYVAPDVQPVAMGGVPTYGKLIDMTSAVADQNVEDGRNGFLTTPLMAGVLRQTLEADAAGARWIWSGPNDNGQIAGYPARATNQVSKTLGEGGDEHGLIYGDWSQIEIGLWGALEIIVDPITLAGRAMIKITTFQMGDVLLRNGVAFAKATGATIE